MKMKKFIIPIVLISTFFYIGETMSQKADDNYRQYVQSLEKKYSTNSTKIERQTTNNVLNCSIMSIIDKMVSYYDEQYPTHVTVDVEMTESDNYYIFTIYKQHKRQKTTLQTFYMDKVCRRIRE